MLLYLALMYKTLGGYTWTGLFYEEQTCGLDNPLPTTPAPWVGEEGEEIVLAWENLKMVS